MIGIVLTFLIFTIILALFAGSFFLKLISAGTFKLAIQGFLVLFFFLPLLKLRPPEMASFEFGFEKRISNLGELKVPIPQIEQRSSDEQVFSPRVDSGAPKTSLNSILAVLVSLGGIVFLFKLVRQQFFVRRLLRELVYQRTFPGLQVCISPLVQSAFCLGIFQKKIFLSTKQFLDQADRKVILRHEFSHLKSQDPFWTLAAELIVHLFFWTGVAIFWKRWFLLVSEVECDRQASAKLNLNKKEYFSVLLSQICVQATPLGSNGMGLSYQHMKRRIQMFNVSRKKSFSKVLLALTLLASAVAGATVQSVGPTQANWTVEDIRRLMADKPIQVPMIYHPAVAAELNRFLATDDSRRKFSRALSRMKAFEGQFKEYFRGSRLPTDYVLLPLIESGYQNIDSSTNKSGGLWQFIPETARRFGLRVDEKVDERFDVEKSTGAAVAYLRVLNNLFNDPRLALLSYNLGEKSLQKKLDEMKQKTIEALLETGRLEKEQRLHIARFQAAMVLYYNPELL